MTIRPTLMRFRRLEGSSWFQVIFPFLWSPIPLSRSPLSFEFIKKINWKLSTVVLGERTERGENEEEKERRWVRGVELSCLWEVAVLRSGYAKQCELAMPSSGCVDPNHILHFFLDFGFNSKFGNWKFREGFRRSIPAAISVRKNVMIEHCPNSPARQPPRASVRNCRRSL